MKLDQLLSAGAVFFSSDHASRKALVASVVGDQELVRYLLAGVVNTLAGYGVFFALFQWAKVSPELANAGGYVAGLFMAFTLNYLFVFTASVLTMSTVLRFVAASLVAFLINQAVLVVLCRAMSVPPMIAQVFAMIAYTVIFYLLNKWFVFSDQSDADKFANGAGQTSGRP